MNDITNDKYNSLLADIQQIINQARHKAYQSFNKLLIQRNWMIGNDLLKKT